MGYPRSSFFNAPETARLIIGLECAIDREGLSDSSFIKRVRAEGALQVEDKGEMTWRLLFQKDTEMLGSKA